MSVQAWLRQQVTLYAASERVFADVDSALARFHALQPKSDVYTFDDGRAQLLICLHGLLPISYRGASYNIPLAVWVVREYPRQPPVVYVVPTSDMLVRPGRYLDVSGRCSHDYLQNWQRKDEGCNLSGLLEDLQDQFSKEPPVYAKPQPREQQDRPPPPVPARPGAVPASPQPQVQVSPPNQSAPLSPPKPPPKPPTEFHHAIATPITHPQAPGPPPPHPPVGAPPQIPPRPPSTLSPLGSRSPVPGPAHASNLQGPISAGHITTISNPPTHFGAQSPPPPVPPTPYTQLQYTASQSPSSQGSYVYPQQQGLGQVPQALTHNQGLGALPRINASQPQPGIASPPQPHSLSPPPPPLPPPPPALVGATGGSSLPFGAQGQGSGQGSVYPPPQPQSQFLQVNPVNPPTRTPVPNLLDDDDDDNSSSSGGAQLVGIQGLPRTAFGGVVSPGQEAGTLGYPPGNASSNQHVIVPPPRPPRPPNPELLLLHERVHAKLTSELQSLSKAFELDAERLRATQRDLLHGEPAIKDESARLEAVKNVCLSVAERTRGAVEKLEGNIGELKRKGDPSVDEMVCAMSIVENQLLNLVAEDNAIEDTIYHLHRALNSGRIDLDRFLRTTRVLAEEQFMKRALINKIQAGLAMTGH